ncbi:hypothetical protein EOT10_23445 [Streptomyces antnestii]|uniref:Uncharacterized protein n=1 Tax=Streptomyces antnestii TaxID=2494256 RepID=A0A437PJD3_9ACTN|nr:hypothetical protein [Streptomyces sp. San01]RVU22386.1 hypothetical protein EOT10_23445 [Streptomyces sp. San01]
MAEPEFTATGVRIGRLLRSLTRAGEVRIEGGRLELLTSYGSEIDSAPLKDVRAGKAWFAPGDRALADVGGRRYLLKLGADRDAAAPAARLSGDGGPSTTRRFLEAVHRARGRRT